MGQGPIDGEAGWSRWPLAQALGWNGQRRRAAGDRLEMTVLSVNGQRGGVPGARTRKAEGALEVSGEDEAEQRRLKQVKQGNGSVMQGAQRGDEGLPDLARR